MFATWFHKNAYRRMVQAAARQGLRCERLEDRTAPSVTRTVSPTEVIVSITGPDPLGQLQSHRDLIGIDVAQSGSLGGSLVSVELNGATPEAAIAALGALPG